MACHRLETAASIDKENTKVMKSVTYALTNPSDIMPTLSHGPISYSKTHST